MAINKRTASGPEVLTDMRELIAARVATIEGDGVMCPFCLRYNNNFKGKKRSHVCQHCTKTFFVLKRSRYSFLTSKRVILSDEQEYRQSESPGASGDGAED